MIKEENYPHGALPLFIGEGDHVVVMGCRKHSARLNSLPPTPHLLCTPSPLTWSPPPYKQGESAIRNAKNRVNLSNLLVYSYLKNSSTIFIPNERILQTH